MIKLIIFDLDGTLLNTIDDLCDSCNYVLSNHNFPIHTPDECKYFVGNGIRKLIERALPKDQCSEEQIDSLFQEFLPYYKLHSADKTAPYDGITETLHHLIALGVKVAVASNKAQEAMGPLLKHYFPDIQWTCAFGQREKVPIKPHPQVVFDILEKTRVAAAETYYIGDTAVDMETAARAGLYKIGAAWGFRTKQELAQSGADIIIDHPSQIIDLL
ncbi:MAG: HAD family hydrolase [Bacteroidales bacterium]|nr:HAD family hydrolase [Bacteroidales bacterium]